MCVSVCMCVCMFVCLCVSVYACRVLGRRDWQAHHVARALSQKKHDVFICNNGVHSPQWPAIQKKKTWRARALCG